MKSLDRTTRENSARGKVRLMIAYNACKLDSRLYAGGSKHCALTASHESLLSLISSDRNNIEMEYVRLRLTRRVFGYAALSFMHAWTKFESVLEKHLHEPCEMMELAERSTCKHRKRWRLERTGLLCVYVRMHLDLWCPETRGRTVEKEGRQDPSLDLESGTFDMHAAPRKRR
jgi:hypothetical protein